MTERMNLNMEDLVMVTGGSWGIETLTEEERTEWKALLKEGSIAQNSGNQQKFYDAIEKIQAYKAILDAKYGPN